MIRSKDPMPMSAKEQADDMAQMRKDCGLTPTSMAEAKAVLIAQCEPQHEEGKDSLDATADALLERIGRFFGECVGGSTFCGISIDETRRDDGLLISLKITACDLVSGDPVRREAR